MKKHLRLFLATTCLLAARAEAETYSYDFSVQGASAGAAEVPSFAVGDRILIAGPDGVSFSLEIVSAPPPGIAGPSFIARDAQGHASAIVKPTADGLRITVDDIESRKTYFVRVEGGAVTASVRDTAGAAGGACGTCAGEAAVPADLAPAPDAAPAAAPRSTRLRAAATSDDEFQMEEHKTIVDVLVAFDQGAKAWAESDKWPGGDKIEEFAADGVSKMNDILKFSQLDDKFEYRLAGVVEVSGTNATAIGGAILGQLRTCEGVFRPVASMRRKSGADTVTLLVDKRSGSTSGIGYSLTTNVFHSFARTCYNCNVCDVNNVMGRYTMSHETGHNMGCGHSNRQGANSGPGCYPYSCGYHFQDANGIRRHTVMAYYYDELVVDGQTTYPHTDYSPVPYFSSPDIVPDDLGERVGTAETNDNRRTLLQTYKLAGEFAEHVLPYEWDVRFVDASGVDIEPGSHFSDRLYVTLTNANPDAAIYYTLDGSTPNKNSPHFQPGETARITLLETKTVTACAVTNGVAISMRSATFHQGFAWSGEAGQNGGGRWSSGDSSVRSWENQSEFFYNGDSVVFPDLAANASPTVSVHGAIAPCRAAFLAGDTAYTFAKGTDDASLHLGDACFAPCGELTFDLPVRLDAVAFTNLAYNTLTFNAPFGQTVTDTEGYCTNAIGIGAFGTLVVAPGSGKTQTFDHFNNSGWFDGTSKFRVGAGTVVFKGPASAYGLFGNAQFRVEKEGCVVVDMSATSYDPFYVSQVSGEGTVVFRAATPVANLRNLAWMKPEWKGTVVFENLDGGDATKDFPIDAYGNANTKIVLKNCSIYYFDKNRYTFPGTLVLEGDGALRLGDNGYSGYWNAFGALEGDGSISAASSHRQAYVFNMATNYTGSITIGASGGTGRLIVFGSTSSIPSQSATITVAAGATASIGGGAMWRAHHGVEVGGKLLVKGASATLDCDESAATGLKLDDGATLRFETAAASLVFAKAPQFESGTVSVELADGIIPRHGTVLASWPDGSAPAGDFELADDTLATKLSLRKTATGLVVVSTKGAAVHVR